MSKEVKTFNGLFDKLIDQRTKEDPKTTPAQVRKSIVSNYPIAKPAAKVKQTKEV